MLQSVEPLLSVFSPPFSFLQEAETFPQVFLSSEFCQFDPQRVVETIKQFKLSQYFVTLEIFNYFSVMCLLRNRT